MKIKLSKYEVFSIDGDARNISIKCETGSLWITQANDSYDHVLHIGEIHNVSRKGKVVMTAGTDSVVGFSNSSLYSDKNIMHFFRRSPLFKIC